MGKKMTPAAKGAAAANVDQEKALARRYIQAGGVKCPFCDSQDIEGGAVEIDFGRAYQKVTCKKCGKTWVDGYSLNSVMFGEEFVYPGDGGNG